MKYLKLNRIHILELINSKNIPSRTKIQTRLFRTKQQPEMREKNLIGEIKELPFGENLTIVAVNPFIKGNLLSRANCNTCR